MLNNPLSMYFFLDSVVNINLQVIYESNVHLILYTKMRLLRNFVYKSFLNYKKHLKKKIFKLAEARIWDEVEIEFEDFKIWSQ